MDFKLLDKYNKKESKKNNYIYFYIVKSLISIIILLISLCLVKKYPNIKEYIKKNVYGNNISFSKINNRVSKYFKNIYPSSVDDIKPVFNDNFIYESYKEYNNGLEFTVSNNYLMPSLENGMIVYSGKKDNYGNTLIISCVNGIDIWYVGLDNLNYKLYDYVKKGDLLGEVVNNKVYIYYEENGIFKDYKEYFK